MTSITQILCPVDFSPFSRRALDHAFAVARCYGARVTALHVTTPMPAPVQPPAYLGAEIGVPLVLPAADRELVRSQVQRLAYAERVPGVDVDVLIEEAPQVHREILAQAGHLHADLIVIGTHGRSGFERLLLGSTAEKVLRLAPCPVMTVPPAMPDAVPRGPAPYTDILCAIDFSPSSERALSYALSLAADSGGRLTLVHVIEVIPLYYDFSPPAAVNVTEWTNSARRRLRDLLPAKARAACTIREVVATGKPYREILTLASELKADLVVMGVQGRGPVDLAFFGSTTHHVVREARCAVLTVRG